MLYSRTESDISRGARGYERVQACPAASATAGARGGPPDEVSVRRGIGSLTMAAAGGLRVSLPLVLVMLVSAATAEEQQVPDDLVGTLEAKFRYWTKRIARDESDREWLSGTRFELIDEEGPDFARVRGEIGEAMLQVFAPGPSSVAAPEGVDAATDLAAAGLWPDPCGLLFSGLGRPVRVLRARIQWLLGAGVLQEGILESMARHGISILDYVACYAVCRLMRERKKDAGRFAASREAEDLAWWRARVEVLSLIEAEREVTCTHNEFLTGALILMPLLKEAETSSYMQDFCHALYQGFACECSTLADLETVVSREQAAFALLETWLWDLATPPPASWCATFRAGPSSEDMDRERESSRWKAEVAGVLRSAVNACASSELRQSYGLGGRILSNLKYWRTVDQGSAVLVMRGPRGPMPLWRLDRVDADEYVHIRVDRLRDEAAERIAARAVAGDTWITGIDGPVKKLRSVRESLRTIPDANGGATAVICGRRGVDREKRRGGELLLLSQGQRILLTFRCAEESTMDGVVARLLENVVVSSMPILTPALVEEGWLPCRKRD